MAQVKALFYLPLQDNDGRDLVTDIAELQRQVFDLFDGWTSLGYVKGAYRMADGTQSLDVSEFYSVVLDEIRIQELEEELLRQFRQGTLQEAIYLEIQRDVDVRFIR